MPETVVLYKIVYHGVKCACVCREGIGNGEELIKKAYADSEESGREYERVVKYVESILADEFNK